MSNAKEESYTGLKNLLSSWGLQHLLARFIEEDINIEELQMMKIHHVTELLGNFKLGTRIRFEYNFEKWRRNIDKPLEINPKYCTINKQNWTTFQQDFANPNTNSIAKPKTITTKVAPLNSNRNSTPLNSNDNQKLNITLPPQPPPPLQPSPFQQLLTPLESNVKTITKPMEKGKIVITVLKILQNGGQKGLSLLEFYNKYKFFTDFQRQMLIQLIVYYFHVNEYHLSLHASYILEKQIIKLFPTEKLDYYRTSKRGKIYIKFCNMKRKREDPSSPTVQNKLTELPSEPVENEIIPETTSQQANSDINTNTNTTDVTQEMDYTVENSNDQIYNNETVIKTEYFSE